MRCLRLRSIRGRLFAAFLCATLIPLLLCSGILLQTFRLRLTRDAAQQALSCLDSVCAALDAFHDGCLQAARAVQNTPAILSALAGEEGAGTQVYPLLYSATERAREYAQFDLYDAQGNWRYSTSGSPDRTGLSTGWGVLGLAGREGGLVYAAAGGAGDPAAPQLQGACPLSGARGERAGYLVVRVYQSHFLRLLSGKYGGQNDLLLLNRYWREVFCSRPALSSQLAPRLRARLLSGASLHDASEEFVCSVAQHPATGLTIVLRQPQVFTRNTMGLLYTISGAMAAVCVLFSVALALVFSRQLSRPVSRLTRAMDRVGRDDLDVQVFPTGNDELGRLSRQFNDMVCALKRNREQRSASQRELNQAQIRMLQAQLNPHFLCNTLDTMKWISKINHVPQVSEMSASLADILRYAISPDEFVPLWRDEEIVERYVAIQAIRLSGGFTYLANIPEGTAECLVPKLMLQPIVENAILHGLDGVEHGGVTVTAREEGGTLLVVVADNGRGLPEEMVGPYGGKGKPEGHLGLYNVDTILKKYYGPACGLTLANRPGGGAVITAALPARREKEGETPC